MYQWNQGDGPLTWSRYNNPSTSAFVHAGFFCMLGLISLLKLIGSERKRYLENQGYLFVIFKHILASAHKLACMHALILCACANISTQMGHIREIEASMESGRHATHLDNIL